MFENNADLMNGKGVGMQVDPWQESDVNLYRRVMELCRILPPWASSTANDVLTNATVETTLMPTTPMVNSQMLQAMMLPCANAFQVNPLLSPMALQPGMKSSAHVAAGETQIPVKPGFQPFVPTLGFPLPDQGAPAKLASCMSSGVMKPLNSKSKVLTDPVPSPKKRKILKQVSTDSISIVGAEANSGNDKDRAPLQKPKRKGLCSREGCTTNARQGGLCAKHGGGKPCAFEGCTKIVAGVSLCSQHGGNRKRKCSVPGCTKYSQSGGFDLCAAHGGGSRCKVPGCNKRRSGKGLCWSHGGGRRCYHTKCTKYPAVNGLCVAHASQNAS